MSNSSYSLILKSSSLIGGANVINYLVGLVRTKLVAMMLGPSGIGLVGLCESTVRLVGIASGLGVGESGVRAVAESNGLDDKEAIAHTVTTLRRACWLTGLLGWGFTVVLARPLSLWTFGSEERAGMVALLGVTLLIVAVSDGQQALLQGIRRIGDLARLSIISVLVSTAIAIGIYAYLGEQGIVPVMIATAASKLAVSWWLARRVRLPTVTQSLSETWLRMSRLAGLGLSFMWSGLLSAGVALVIRSLIVREMGLEANGMYQAAWSMSGMFAGFILNAMGADFYPRLTEVAEDNRRVSELVNEQTEIGVLLALPGMVATIVFGPALMRLFFTAEFLPAAVLLPWFVLGIFGRVLSWPMGFVQLAKAKGKWFAASQTVSNAIQLGLAFVLLHKLGLIGVAIGFAIHYAIHTIGIFWVAVQLCEFRWSKNVVGLISRSIVLIIFVFILQQTIEGRLLFAIGLAITFLALSVSLRELVTRLGVNHRLVRGLLKLPGSKFLINR